MGQFTSPRPLKEINRIYARLKQEHKDAPEKIAAAEKAWKQHYRAQVEALNLAYNKEGTIYQLSATTTRMGLVRDFALNLARWGRF